MGELLLKEINKSEDIKHKYAEIINLEYHPKSKATMEKRASQFMPFAALKGYDEEIYETSRITEEKKELMDDMKEILNNKLNYLNEHKDIMGVFTYFIKDSKKEGGKYSKIKGSIKKIDNIYGVIYLQDKTKIKIEDIIDIEVG